MGDAPYQQASDIGEGTDGGKETRKTSRCEASCCIGDVVQMKPERAAEILGLLTAKSGGFEVSIRGFNSLTRSDVILALSLVTHKGARLLARIKYADQRDYLPDMETYLVEAIERGALERVVDGVARARWRLPRPGFITNMCRMALVEIIHPHICFECLGRGFQFPVEQVEQPASVKRKRKRGSRLVNKNLVVECKICNGTGRKRILDQERAKLMGVNADAWAHTWRDRYRGILTLLDQYDGIVTSGVAKRIA